MNSKCAIVSYFDISVRHALHMVQNLQQLWILVYFKYQVFTAAFLSICKYNKSQKLEVHLLVVGYFKLLITTHQSVLVLTSLVLKVTNLQELGHYAEKGWRLKRN